MGCPSHHSRGAALRLRQTGAAGKTPAALLAFCVLLFVQDLTPVRAQLLTVPAPAGISGEIIVAAPPGESAVIYTVGLLGLFNKSKLNQIDITISPLGPPLNADLDQADFVQLRLIESDNATFGDGDDVVVNTIPQGSIDVSGGVTSVPDGGNASMLGIFPLPFDVLFKFYFIVADMSANAVTGNALRVGAAANHISTSVPSTIGAAIAPDNADRVVVNKLVPIIGIAPASLGFGNVLVFSSSSLPLTVSNTGAADLDVTSVNDGQFVPDITTFSVPPGGSQIVNVAFMPTVTGPQAAVLAITHNDTLPSIVTNVPMDGTGISPQIGTVPPSLAYGDVLVGTPEVIPLTVSNTGTAPLNVTNITSDDGQFVSNLTSFVVAPGGNQVINVTFTPASSGPHSGTLSIVHDDQLTGSPTTVAVSGSGISPVIGLSPGALGFGTVQVGSPVSLPLTVSNTGGSNLVVTSVTSDDGQFVPDITSFTVPPGGNQIIDVTFTPSIGGAQAGILTLVHNAAGNPSGVAMSGTGTDPGFDAAPPALSFGNVAVGSFSVLALTITNTGSSPLNVTNVTSDDGQYVPDITSFVVAAGANQVINVTFTPTATGVQLATLTIVHNAGGSPSAVSMSGTGTSPDIGLSPTSLSYGSVAVGSPSVRALTITNTGAAPLDVTNITSDDGQFLPDATTFTVGAGANRVVNVTFTPAGDGPQSGALSIVHNATGSPATVPMSGTGTSAAISVAPATLAFGSVVVGESTPRNLTITNPGTAALTVNGITSDDGQFSPGSTSFSVPAGGNRIVAITFAPSAPGAQAGTLSIAHNATGSPTAVPMGGTGTAPVYGGAPGALVHGDVAIGSPSLQTLTVTNTGTASLSVTGVTSDDGQFVPDINTFTVPPGGNQAVNVTFMPTAEGLQSGTLTLTHNAAGSPSTVTMNGTGTSPGFALVPGSLSFGNVALGTSSALAFSVTNPGNRDLQVTNITSGDGQFVPDITFFTVVPGGSRVVNVTFTPAGSGLQSTALAITHNGTGSPGSLSLSGSGTNPGITVSRDSLAFGNLVFGNATSLSLTVFNIGGAPLTVSDISSSDPQFAPDLVSFALPAGGSQVVTVTFTPANLGSKSGILFITHDALGGFAAVPMTGHATVDVALQVGFSAIPVGSDEVLPVTVTNPDVNPVTITNVVSNSGQFTPNLTTFTIPPGGSQVIDVTFTPRGAGEQTGILSITHNPTVTVALTGIGLGASKGGGAPGERPLVVPFGGEVLMALAVALYALRRIGWSRHERMSA
ncbi:beta strand repeat-containing protein [Candidatus Latescibacterota bacterium]